MNKYDLIEGVMGGDFWEKQLQSARTLFLYFGWAVSCALVRNAGTIQKTRDNKTVYNQWLSNFLWNQEFESLAHRHYFIS